MTKEELEKKYVGKRVAVYVTGSRRVAKVLGVLCEDLKVSFLESESEWYVHHKQVRILKKKERRRLWIRKDLLSHHSLTVDGKLSVTTVYRIGEDGWVEFVEAKK